MRLDPNVPSLVEARSTMTDAGNALQRAGRRHDALEALEHLQAAIDAMKRAERLVVLASREQGATWEHVADLYGVTRQAARQRFGAGGE